MSLRAVFELQLWEVWRHVSGSCSFQLSEKIGRLKLKACGNSHAERTEQKGVTTGGKNDWATEWKKTSTSHQSHYAAEIDSATLSSFCFHFETTQVSRIQEFSVFKLSFAVLDFLILPDSSTVLCWRRYIRLICCIFSHVGLGRNAILDIRLYFLKVPT